MCNIAGSKFYRNMKIIKQLIPSTLLIFALHACSVGKNRIATIRQSAVAEFSLANFNGDYKLRPDSCSQKKSLPCSIPPSLWEALYSCKKFKDEPLKLSTNVFVNLNFDGKSRLVASLYDSGKMLRQIELHAKLYKNNVAVRKKMFLIPIPIIFYIQQERKLLLGNNADRSLNTGYSTFAAAQILLGSSTQEMYTLYFSRN